ncbi:MAG: hypothetical protein ACLP8S_01015 [Solirubrobacteraceae bacterium]
MGFLSGRTNVVLVSQCSNLQGLKVTLEVTEDLVTVGDIGFGLQLNCFPQAGQTFQNQTLNWFQYGLVIGSASGRLPGMDQKVGWFVEYWNTNAGGAAWPPGYTPNPSNTTPARPVIPNDSTVAAFADAPSNQILQGSILEVQLSTDTNGNVTEATFNYTDPGGDLRIANYTFQSNAVFPIYGAQPVLVGPFDGAPTSFSSGAGTLTCTISSGSLGVETTSCGGYSEPATAEDSNSIYGDVTPATGSTVTQSVAVVPMTWVDNDLTAFAGGTPADVNTNDLDGYSQGDGSQHVNFVDEDGHVHELYRSPDPAAQWVDNDLTKFAGGTAASEESPALHAYVEGDGSQHVNFVDEHGHVHELYRSPDPAAQWVDNDLTKFAGGTPAVVPTWELDGYSEGDKSQHVNFIDGNGHIHELYRSPDPAAQWVDNDLTKFAEGTSAFVESGLDGYSEDDGIQHVNFIDGNGHVHELYRSPDPAAQWVDNDLTALAGGTRASGTLDGYSQGDGSQHVNFVNPFETFGNTHVHELFRSAGPEAQWVDNDLTALAGGASAFGAGLVGYSQGDGSQYVIFYALTGVGSSIVHVHELYRGPDPAAQWVDMT